MCIPHHLCLVIGLAGAAIVIGVCGCSHSERKSSEPVMAVSVPTSLRESDRADDRRAVADSNSSYANDTDRLSTLISRMNDAIGQSYTGSFAQSPESGPMIGVDYALFSRLSDDGVAVMIGEAIASRSMAKPGNVSQTSATTDALAVDQMTGKYVAKAGFGDGGFNEWLQAAKVAEPTPSADSTSDYERSAAFAQGYLSGKAASRDGKQTIDF